MESIESNKAELQISLLSSNFIEPAIQLLFIEFPSCPIDRAYNQFLIKHHQPIDCQINKQYWTDEVTAACHLQCSPVAFEVQNSNKKLIGVFLVKNIHIEDSPEDQIDIMLAKQIKIAFEKHSFLTTAFHFIACLSFLVVDHNFRGKKISTQLLKSAEQYAKNKGFHYAIIHATNGITNVLARKNNYEELQSLDLQGYESNGEYPFASINDFDKMCTIWSKKL